MYRNRALGREAPFEQQFRQRILDPLLYRALERPGSENGIEAHLGQFGQCLVGHLQRKVHFLQTRPWSARITMM